MYLCMCVYIYIYIYIYRERERGRECGLRVWPDEEGGIVTQFATAAVNLLFSTANIVM